MHHRCGSSRRFSKCSRSTRDSSQSRFRTTLYHQQSLRNTLYTLCIIVKLSISHRRSHSSFLHSFPGLRNCQYYCILVLVVDHCSEKHATKIWWRQLVLKR
ncbi:hypothetical protein P8452_76536 [Trifolium repens]|nr:hypothetical protein P8452_76536 [Trifolium repens]